jgi:DNA-binding MarR family transcriptional regulator
LIASLLESPLAATHAELPCGWTELAEALGRCERRLRDDLARYAAPLGITPSQFSLLWACRAAPAAGLSQNELAAVLALSPAHVSAQVEQMRAKGLLIGQRRAPDRRRQVWQLTSDGENQLQALLAALVAWAGQLEEGLSAGRRETLAALLAELAAVLDAQTCAGNGQVSPLEKLSQAGAAS